MLNNRSEAQLGQKAPVDENTTMEKCRVLGEGGMACAAVDTRCDQVEISVMIKSFLGSPMVVQVVPGHVWWALRWGCGNPRGARCAREPPHEPLGVVKIGRVGRSRDFVFAVASSTDSFSCDFSFGTEASEDPKQHQN